MILNEIRTENRAARSRASVMQSARTRLRNHEMNISDANRHPTQTDLHVRAEARRQRKCNCCSLSFLSFLYFFLFRQHVHVQRLHARVTSIVATSVSIAMSVGRSADLSIQCNFRCTIGLPVDRYPTDGWVLRQWRVGGRQT